MSRLLFFASMLLLAISGALTDGCASRAPVFLSGTKCSLGAYIPWSDNLYGITLIDFTTGTYMRFPTNTAYGVSHDSASTNTWMWGLMESITGSKTKADAK